VTETRRFSLDKAGCMTEQKGLALPNNSKRSGRDRRTSPRCPPSSIPSLKSARLSDGTELNLINISRGGALIESESRMIPGLTICIRMVAADALLMIRGRILRSKAKQIRGSTIVYQSAIAFDEDFSLLTEDHEEVSAQDGTAATPSREEGSAPDNPCCQPDTADGTPPDVLTITVPIHSVGPDLRQMFGLNDW
jgi:hypothetical protein